MKHFIRYNDAVHLIQSYTIAAKLPIAGHPDLPAIITHWLQNPEGGAILTDKETVGKWRRLLSTHARITKYDTWNGKPLVPGSNKISYNISYEGIPFLPKPQSKFKFIELFAGIGGFRLALQQLGGRCVFASEINTQARQTYFRNYGEYPFGDIRQFTGDHISDEELDRIIPDHTILAAGFPCQPFSRAGLSARRHLNQATGFECQSQGTLFFDIVRIARVKRPRIIFLENVKHLQAHDNGRTFEVIKRTIQDALGYSFAAEVIDSSTVVPQRRKRCYIVCFRNKKKVFEFPSFEGDPLALESILESDPDEQFTISDKLWSGHINRTQRNLDRGSGFKAHAADLSKPANTLIARYGKDGKECLIPQTNGKNPRKLTPRECARLQGFPEEFLLPETRSTTYRQFGNTVAVPVVSRIAQGILKKLSNISNGKRRNTT